MGTVNVTGGGVTARSLTFNTAGYTIGGGLITLNTGSLNGQLNANQDATINSAINKTGAGYFNGIVASGAALTFNGSLNASAASEMYFQGAGNVVINGSIGGNFTNFRLNSGTTTVTFAAPNSFTGHLWLEAGGGAKTVNFSNVDQLGVGTGGNFIAIQGGSTLRYTGATAGATTNRDIYWNGGAATIDVTNADGNLILNSTGGTRNGAFTKAGAGTLTLSAVNAAAADISGTINLTGTLAFDAINANNATWSGAISGGGEVLKTGAGAGTLFLSSASNSYTGDTTVASGTLAINGAGRLGSGSYASDIAVASGATFSYTSTAAQTLSGVISGDGELTKTNTGALTLSGASSNTYTGTTTVMQGSLTLAKTGGALAMSGDLTFDNNLSPDVYTIVDNQFAPGAVVSFITNAGDHGRLELIGTTQTVAGIQTVGYTIARGIIQNREFGPANTGTGTLVLDGSGDYSYNGYLRNATGTLALTKTGSGTQTLAGAQITYTGATTVNNGVLELSNATGFNSAVTVNSGGTLRFTNTTNISNLTGFNVTLTNGAALTHNGQTNGSDWWVLPGGVTTSGNTTINQDSITNTTGSNKNFFIDGGLHGTGTVTINAANAGNAVVFRNNNSTFSGTLVVNGLASTTVNAGSGIGVGGATVALQNADITLNGTMELLNQGIGWSAAFPGAFRMGALNGSGVMIGNFTSGGGTTVTLGNTNNDGSFSGVVANGTGNVVHLTKIGSGTQTLSGVNAYTGTTTISGGVLAIGGAGQLNGGSYAGSIVNNAVFRYESSANQTLSGPISGAGQLIKEGAGVLTLSGNTTYSGGTSVNQGTLVFNLTSRSNNAAMNLGTINVAANTTLEMFTSVAPNYGATALTTGGTVFTGSGTIVKTGTGIVDWWGTSAANTTSIKDFTGLIDIQQGTLANQTTNDWSVSAGAMSVNIASGAFFDLRTAGAVINNLTGAGTIGSSFSSQTLTVGAQHGSSTFNGVIQNAGLPAGAGSGPIISLIKTGTGTQILAGANTYTGTTTISGGTLLVNGTHTGAGAYNVNSGTLGGIGSITTNNASVTLAGGGKLSPGASAGTLTLSLGGGSLNLSGITTGALIFEIGAVGASDQVVLTSGTLNLGSGGSDLNFAEFTFSPLGGIALGNSYTLFDASSAIVGTIGTSGSASGLFEGGQWGGFIWVDNTNNNVMLTVDFAVVPEPSSFLLGSLGLIGLAGFALKRKFRRDPAGRRC